MGDNTGKQVEEDLNSTSIRYTYKCPQCEKRYVRSTGCKEHHDRHHKNFGWSAPEATPDPKPKKVKSQGTQDDITEKLVTARKGEEVAQGKKRKRSATSQGMDEDGNLDSDLYTETAHVASTAFKRTSGRKRKQIDYLESTKLVSEDEEMRG